MKKIMLPLFCAMMMLSCTGNKTQENVEPTDSAVVASDTIATSVEEVNVPSIEEVITEQIDANYNAALKAGNEASSIKKYCSSVFISTYNKYQKAIEGEIGDIDYDIWLQAQDSSNPSAKVDAVTINDDNNAEVDLALTNFGNTQVITLTVVKEGETWKIDDFANAGQSVVKIMRENIKAFSE